MQSRPLLSVVRLVVSSSQGPLLVRFRRRPCLYPKISNCDGGAGCDGEKSGSALLFAERGGGVSLLSARRRRMCLLAVGWSDVIGAPRVHSVAGSAMLLALVQGAGFDVLSGVQGAGLDVLSGVQNTRLEKIAICKCGRVFAAVAQVDVVSWTNHSCNHNVNPTFSF